MSKFTPEVLARLTTLEALVFGDWQQKHPEYEPFEIIANLDGGYGDDGTQVRYDKVCVVDEDLPGARALATAELIPLMRNHLKALLAASNDNSADLELIRLRRENAEAHQRAEDAIALTLRANPESPRLQWIAFSDRVPPKDHPKVFVTNLLGSIDGLCHIDHVWMVDLVFEQKDGEPRGWMHAGLYYSFDEYDGITYGNLTHWRPAFPEEWPSL